KMTVELFDSIINTSQDCVLWKDIERRFLGVNQAFLDFYGFESADELIGKTDEDMGWHSDPEPFRQDERRVLSGRSTYKVQGKCMVRGEERDIIASKRPLYNGDEIVGLVGSFVDITDVLRRGGGQDNARAAYSMEKLRKYRFFDSILDEISLEEILDPLTGVLSRTYAVKFVQRLIDKEVPFTFTMIDLDNFKYFNDSFGHSAGDKVLITVTEALAKYTEGFGLVGRFGGDELLLIDLKHITKEEKYAFFHKLYNHSDAMRIEIDFGNVSSFITGTSGVASFPEDSDNFDNLFGIIDKMLYLGKRRGRNCYSVYDEEKHKNLEITKLSHHGIYSSMSDLRNATDEAKGFEAKLKVAMPFVLEALQVNDMYFVGEDGKMKSVNNLSFEAEAGDIAGIFDEDMFFDSTLERVEQNAPVFYSALKQNGFESALAAKIRKQDKVYGYLVCAVKRSFRIWQERECAIMYYLAGILAESFV
ncbi:MAG: GGDEF domain-containing protein, partial [Lachnospiraceae bacterium]|nr:GGDEF domain-containing protein [Lachnospiraceae bacterium]